jgi:hypothetical protein
MPAGARADACFVKSAQLARRMLQRLIEQARAVCPET